MTIELRPLGVLCNIACEYCYQNPQREAGNVRKHYDLDAMKAGIEEVGGPFSLFGGEPLLVPLDDLENLWSWGLERYGSNGIQSNGSLITDAHIRLFQKYRVHVGISIDGPGPLNDARWAGSLDRTRETTEKSEKAIERLCSEGMPPSLITTVTRCNGTPDKLATMCEWFKRLESMGVTSVRLHLLESENSYVREKFSLSPAENLVALTTFLELERDLTDLKFDMFRDMEGMLLARDNDSTCVWNACDPYTTRAVQGMEGSGQHSNCGRTNKDGIDFVKADVAGFERYIALYHTPQEYGGCQDCRFFLMCKGQCPGTAVNQDWRNRTEHCEVIKSLYIIIERALLDRGEAPISAQPVRRSLEERFLEIWAGGKNPTMHSVLRRSKRQ